MPFSLKSRSIIKALSFFFAFLLTQFPAFAREAQVQVLLFKAHLPIERLYFAGPLRILQPAGQSLGKGLYELSHDSSGFKISAANSSGFAPLIIRGQKIEFAPACDYLSVGYRKESMRRYHGKILVSMEGSKISCRNLVLMRSYVDSVVGSETRIEFPLEALKAQSVLIQTAMLRYKKGDELNDSTDKQAYLGANYERAEVLQAVRQTWGQTLFADNRPLPIYFHSSCAGSTSSSELFTGKRPELPCDKAVSCNYCTRSPFWQTKISRIPRKVFVARFPEGMPKVLSKDIAGRAMLVKYANSGLEESGYQFWLKVGQRLGWDKMPGTRFELSTNSSGELILSSTGAGHGVGLCQWGACGLAKEGKNYQFILNYYFPGSVLRKN